MAAALNACPSAGILERLLAEQLTSSERDSVETHVELCANCQDQLEGLVAKTLPEAAAVEGRRRESELEPAEGFLSRLRELVPPRPNGFPAAPVPAHGRLGPYEILGKLGKGGMGAVFKACHTELGKVVALKVLPAEKRDEVSVARFKKEVRAIGQLDHPNIVVAYDAGEARGINFLVMELVDGLDLGRVIDHHSRLSIADACEAVRQAAVGLQHAYEQGLVHRDIKPNNLMLARDGRVRVLDLGLARVASEATAEALTAQGTVLGTADYLAPEQWDEPHTADTRADIYSLGCTLYHALAGRPPFAGGQYKSLPCKMQAHREILPPPIGPYCPDAPAGLLAALDRMLAKDPADRFATPADVAAALRPFTTGAALERLIDPENGAPGSMAAAGALTPAPGSWETGRERRKSTLARTRHRVPSVLLAGLAVMVAATVIAWPWVGRSPTATDKPLEVKDLHVDHYRGKGENVLFLSDLRTSTGAVRLNDNVQMTAGLTVPAYYYLIAFNPQGSQDGLEQLCQPEGDKNNAADLVRPDRRTEVRYPAGSGGFEVDAVGLQAFVLAASTKTLPPYKEWRKKAGDIPWMGMKDGGAWRWHFDGREFTRFPRERGPVVPHADVPDSLQKLRDFFAKRPEFDVVQIVAFPVVDHGK